MLSLEPKKVTSQIYQGGWIRPQHIPELVQLGITHILNLDLPYSDPLPFIKADITLHNITIIDACLMTPQLVRDVMGVIERSLFSPDHKIYIHCVEGVSRSPTIIWLYLIHTGLSPDEARIKVHPNPSLYNTRMVQGLI